MRKGIRKLMLECPDFVRHVRLTDEQIELYKSIKARGNAGMRSTELSLIDGVTVQNASMKLNALRKKGYLKRRVVSAASGGNEGIFTAIEFR